MGITPTGEIGLALILGGFMCFIFFGIEGQWNKYANKRRAEAMTRQSAHRTVTESDVRAMIAEYDLHLPLIEDLWHAAYMDGRHDQATGDTTRNPYDPKLW